MEFDVYAANGALLGSALSDDERSAVRTARVMFGNDVTIMSRRRQCDCEWTRDGKARLSVCTPCLTAACKAQAC